MLPVLEAETRILSLTHPLNPESDLEWVPLSAAAGRILAQPVSSQLDFPHWDNSAMDGYAVRQADVATSCPDAPTALTVVEEIPAGYQPQQTIQPGQAARILTGAMMPPGADAVVMQEETRREGDRVYILSAPTPQQFVRRRGEFYRAGDRLLPAGVRLGAAEIAVLAAAQCVTIPVYRRLRVAILSTGDELVSPDQPLRPGQIVDSNQYALAALVAEAGAEPLMLGIVPDQPDALQTAIAQAVSTADVVLSSGGVSVGDYDYVDRLLEALGATIHIRAIAIKPGKPLTFATFKASQSHPPTAYFGLPGNPVSALVTFWRFVLPALRKQAGLSAGWGPAWIWGRSPHDLEADGKRETYLWGTLRVTEEGHEFSQSPGSFSSGNLINLAQTNALAQVPVGQTRILAGTPIRLMQTGGGAIAFP
ncbi:molybdopterin molybdotransferase MoeA [Thermoleptolyngbya oregonensis NK1-22]|uniref:Molybdopterin molybdenumtransferase n=1 Tax=Thermoleptolyngbya oregonensis NK1-22 TaxID=2547457 RepID=A0AA97BBU9_9CYAN|nr:molybdopterin molybdotransferase MoeA [Thermoleptolyngbya oregonensis NK1-22]